MLCGIRKERLELTETERQTLQELVRKGENKARVITRARLLLLSNQGWDEQKVADPLRIGHATVERIRRRAVREGVETALVDRPRPGQKRKLDTKQEARLVAIACSDPPPGQKRWTVHLLMEEILQKEVVDRISFETVRRVLKKTVSNLQSAEQLRNNLMADISHELRTPLTVLEGNLRAALDHVYTLDEAEIANLYGQTHHLIRLVNDLRELALEETRQLPLEKSSTYLKALLEDTLQTVGPLAIEKDVNLLEEIPPLPPVQVDPGRMRQVFINLLSNSLRHTPPGGSITVRG